MEELKNNPAAPKSAGATQPVEAATLTVEELAALLKISVAHAYKGLKDGRIPSIRLGTRYIIPASAVMRWLDDVPLARQLNQIALTGDSKQRVSRS